MRTVTLCAASNIQRSTDLFTSKEGPDLGSTYFRFSCAECRARLGLYYLTTPKDLDELREKFTFSYKSVSLYELGNAQHGGDRPVPLDNSDQPHPVSEESESGTEDVTASDGQSVGLSVKEEIARVSPREEKPQFLIVKLKFVRNSPDVLQFHFFFLASNCQIKHVITGLHERMTVSEKLQHDTVDYIKNMRTESPRVSPMQYPQQMTVTQTMTSITPLAPPNSGSHMGFLPNDSTRKRTRM